VDERINGLTMTRQTLATALRQIDPAYADNLPARCEWDSLTVPLDVR